MRLVAGLDTHLPKARGGPRAFQAAAAIHSSPLALSDDGTTYVLSGYNLQIVNGSGATDGAVNGLGNLIVGYNENPDSHPRTGSHNLVTGPRNGYTSFGGFVAGRDNQITGPYSSVSGGVGNLASGFDSSVSGGSINRATAFGSSVSGGSGNWADGAHFSILGGIFVTVSGLGDHYP